MHQHGNEPVHAELTWLGASYVPYEWYGSRPFMVDLRSHDVLFAVCQAIGAAFVLGVIVYGPDLPVYKLLDSAITRFYGRISYSFYLYHFMILCALALVVMRLTSPTILIPHAVPFQVALLFVSVAVTTPIAFLSFVAVEKTFIALGRKLDRVLLRSDQPKVEGNYVKS